MKKQVFWRLFNAAVLTTVVWSAIGLEVYGGLNDSRSGGTLLDVFRGRGNASNSAQMTGTPTPAPAPAPTLAPAPALAPAPTLAPAPQMTNIPAQPNDYGQSYEPAEGMTQYPGSQYVPSTAPTPQGSVQNKWSIKNWLKGAAPVQPQNQYVEPAPPLMPAYNQPHSHAQSVMPKAVMPKGQKTQYSVVPLDSKDFVPQEGAIYNEKGEMIYNPESGEAMPDFVGAETMPDGDEWGTLSNENMQNAPIMPPLATPSPQPQLPTPNSPLATPNSPLPANNVTAPRNESEPGVKRVIVGGRARQSTPLNQERVYSPAPAPMPVNPYAQQPTAGSGKSIISSEDSGSLKLESGSAAFSQTYKPIDRLTSIPAEPVMDMAGPELTEALPQSENMGQNTPEANASHSPAIGAAAPAASPVIEELHSASPLENLSEKNAQTPALEPVPESVPEIDVPKEAVGSRQEAVGSSNSPEANSTPLATRNSQLATATQTPLIVEISGPDEVEFGKNEMFSLSVINPTDAVRRDVVLSVHPEGFGDDKTASLNLEQLAPGEKKSVSMKLNARQYNNLSLTAHVRDGVGLETTKKISVNVKNESVKISILPPQAGNAYVGQPTQYIVRIINNGPRVISLNAVAFFGNGIEPIRATGAPNTIQSGQVVVDKPIELKQGEMRDLKIVAVAFQPGIHKMLVQLFDSRGATYAAKESCAYRQRELDEDETETIETDARIELTPGKSEIGVWKAAGESGNRQETVSSSDSPSAPSLNAPDAVPLTQPDQGPRGDLIMPMFAQ